MCGCTASALVCVSPLIQDKNRASLHDIRTDLEERFNFSPLLLEAPLGGTLDRGRGASGSGAARPPKQCAWVSWAEQARALDEAERNSSGDEDGDDLRARRRWREGVPLKSFFHSRRSATCTTVLTVLLPENLRTCFEPSV